MAVIGITPCRKIEDYRQAILHVGGEPRVLDVSTGVEAAPGRKDAIKVKRFVEHARAAAPTPYLGPDELPYDWADE